jgi:hypothetical protein
VQALLGGEVAQPWQRQVMAGEDGEHLLVAVQSLGQHALEFGTQRLDVRRQSRTGAGLGPQQPLGERCEPCRLTLGPGHQRLAHHLFPSLERAPDVAIRTAHGPRRMLDGAMLAHGAEQVEQRVVQRRPALVLCLEGVLQVDAAGLHVGSVSNSRRSQARSRLNSPGADAASAAGAVTA